MIGDSCVDTFVYCDVKRLAPDLPIPVLEKIFETSNPGMAMNVARNLEAIGMDVQVFTNQDWELNTKTRFVDRKSNHSFFRLDAGQNPDPMSIIPHLAEFEAVVVSDYDKGYLTESAIEEILTSHPRCFLDTKKKLGTWARHAHLIKINEYEYQRSQKFIESAPEIRAKIVRTLGGDGADYRGEVFPVSKVEVVDSSGAGDAFLAALVGGLLRNQPLSKAIDFANRKSSEVIQHRGVTVIHG